MYYNTLTSRSERHLINIIKNTTDHHPNFALFLGAGASITSGVKSASNMILDWRKQHYEQYSNGKKTEEEHLSQFYWYKKPEEYSFLFESLYDQPSQRREHIESCVKEASPSWGYIYLVNLIRNSTFNTVLTTNFDDLLNEACYLFSSDVRPMVCAHDSSILSLRITSRRPKIIKLHGDFLFDDIKNTVRELETLETNIRDKLKQIASEFGLIFVGYAGNDRSVMETLGTLLKNENNFPHGIYWCILKGEKDPLSYKLQIITRYPKVNLIEIDGFDEFFANLHDALGLELQPEIANPYEMLAKKLNCLLENTKIPDTNIHPVINQDIKKLGNKLKKMSHDGKKAILNPKKIDAVHLDVGKGFLEWPIPYSLLAQINERENELEEALDYIILQLQKRPQDKDFFYAFQLLYKFGKNKNYLKQLVDLVQENKTLFCDNPFILNNIGVELIKMAEYEYSEKILQMAIEVYKNSEKTYDDFIPYVRMNQMQIKRHQGNNLSNDEISYLKKLKVTSNPIIIMGAEILLQENESAIQHLRELIQKKVITPQTFNNWPIFKLLSVELSETGEIVENLSIQSEKKQCTKQKA